MPLVRTAEELKAWKRSRRVKNKELARLTGRSVTTIDRKLNGRTGISELFTINLANVDRLIEAGLLPESCPERLGRLIVTGVLR